MGWGQSRDAAKGSGVLNRRQASSAAAVGNLVEWYDFGLYGFLAPVLAAQFFPAAGSTLALMATFAVFGVAFLSRPLGSLVFGHLGDIRGRRMVLSLTILLMSLSTFAIGVLPHASSVGIIAPILLLLARLTQGFSAGGELGGAIAYITEYAPRTARGRYGSWVFFTQGLGMLAAAVLVTTLTVALGSGVMQDWGWRLPFLLALPIGLIGLYLRWRGGETPSFAALQEARAVAPRPIRTTFQEHPKQLLQVTGVVVTTTTALLMLTAFVPAYLVESAGLRSADALLSSIAGLVVFLVLCPILGSMSDRLGRRALMLATPLAAMAFALPAFILFSSGHPAAAVLGGVLLGLVLAPFGGAGAAALAELFPTRLRYSGIAIGSAIGIALAGGFAPVLLTWLVSVTGSLLAPAAVLIGFGAVSLVAVMTMRETRGALWEPDPLS